MERTEQSTVFAAREKLVSKLRRVKISFYFFKVFVVLCLLFLSLNFSLAQNIPCKFDEKTLQFSGSPKEQARCLLRPVKIRGVLGEQLKTLPYPLEKLVSQKVKIKKEDLRVFLQVNKISEISLGGSLDEPLSIAVLPNGEQIQANYFLIHDVSTPNYLLKLFPDNINAPDWIWNELSRWEKQKVAHIFVNRLGESVTAVEFGKTLPEKSYGTKLARDKLKAAAKGLQIHVELVQPRRSDSAWFAGNDAIAPDIGFTEQQYERLALLYLAASIRRGTWLIPAFHCAVDAGIPDAHDDPQNFQLEMFAGKLQKLLEAIKTLKPVQH